MLLLQRLVRVQGGKDVGYHLPVSAKTNKQKTLACSGTAISDVLAFLCLICGLLLLLFSLTLASVI